MQIDTPCLHVHDHTELWEEASRVSREYVPDSGGEGVPPDVPALLQRAADHADAAEWWDAVRLLAAASAAAATAAAPRLAERAALRAARLARDHLHDGRRKAAADMLAERYMYRVLPAPIYI